MNPLREIKQIAAIPSEYWDLMYMPILKKLNEVALEQVVRAARLRRSKYLPPGCAAEDILAVTDRWTFAVIIAAAIRVGVDEKTIPHFVMSWINEDHVLLKDWQLAMATPAIGIVASIVNEALNETEETVNNNGNDEQVVKGQQAQSPTDMFFDWLIAAIESGDVDAGIRGAAVHVVAEGALLVWPKLFRQFNEDNSKAMYDLLKQEYECEEARYDAGNGVFIYGIVIPEDDVFPDGDIPPLSELTIAESEIADDAKGLNDE
ncbi:MAG: DNA-binding domain-containing protein [Mariprofundales bacterium]